MIREIKWHNHKILGNLELNFTKPDGTPCSEFVPMEHTKQYLHTDRNGRTTVYQTLPTFIRNSIDHPDSGYSYTENELRKSIELLIKLCR